MLCGYIRNCASYAGGDDIFRNLMKKWPESEKWSPNHVVYIKISPKWGRIHGDVIKRMLDTSFKSPKEATCSRNAHICNVFWGPAWGAWGGWKGEGANDRTIRPKIITKTSSIWAFSTSKKWDLPLKMLRGYIRNCASYAGGEHIFRKSMKKSCRKVKNGAQIMSDSWKYHGNGAGYIKMLSKSCRIHH